MRPDPAGWEAWFGRLLRGDAVAAAPALRRAVAVHANNAMVAACDALAGNYPVLRAALGEEAFTALARAHVRSAPPRDPRLCLYGRRLDRSITAAAALAPWPWLADLARLEWAVVAALFAADPPARPRRLREDRAWPLAPATHWIVSDWPVASLWAAHQPGADWPAAFPAHGELALVTRAHGRVQVQALAGTALPLLEALRRRTPLGALPEAMISHLPAVAGAGALVPAVGDGQ